MGLEEMGREEMGRQEMGGPWPCARCWGREGGREAVEMRRVGGRALPPRLLLVGGRALPPRLLLGEGGREMRRQACGGEMLRCGRAVRRR